MATTTAGRVLASSLAELKARGFIVLPLGGHGVAVFYHEGRVYAVDNRCPHMGFPLSRGTVRDGLLTCHWHHARFDLCSGGTLDPFADNVRSYPVMIENGQIWLDPRPAPVDERSHWERRLREGLEHSLSLVTAKAVLALLSAGAEPAAIVALGGRYGTRYRDEGWGAGMTILTAMANVLPRLAPEDRPIALFHGLVRVSEDCSGRPPRFALDPLPGNGIAEERLRSWLRRSIQVRDADGAERALQTAIAAGVAPQALASMLYAAATDHYFIDTGHVLDYVNKACEFLDLAGWSEAPAVLGSLIPAMAAARRSEELNAWRHPVDLVALVEPALQRLPALAGGDGAGEQLGEELEPLAWTLLDGEPEAIVGALVSALERGVAVADLGQAAAYAAALRLARFHTGNEFGDWDTLHNTWSSCNALHQALLRAPSPELARGVFHAAMRIYLDRFLNIPAARLPDQSGAGSDSAGTERLLDLMDREQQVNPAGQAIDAYLATGVDPVPLIQALGHAVLREDAGFHMYQTLEAGLRQFDWTAIAPPARRQARACRRRPLPRRPLPDPTRHAADGHDRRASATRRGALQRDRELSSTRSISLAFGRTTMSKGLVSRTAPASQPVSLAEASAFLRASGLVLEEITGTRVTGHLRLGPEHHTPWGIVHGGVYSTAIESAASLGACVAVQDRGQVAVGLHQHDALSALHHRRNHARGGGCSEPGSHAATVARRYLRRIRPPRRPRRRPAPEHRRLAAFYGWAGAGRLRTFPAGYSQARLSTVFS